MSLLLLLALGAGLAATGLTLWLRRPAEDRSQEALGLGEGSDLSGRPSAEADVATNEVDDSDGAENEE